MLNACILVVELNLYLFVFPKYTKTIRYSFFTSSSGQLVFYTYMLLAVVNMHRELQMPKNCN